MDTLSPLKSTARASLFVPKMDTPTRRLSVFLKKTFQGDTESSHRLSSRQIVEDPLKRKSFVSPRYRSTRSGYGRLLAIIAGQAVSGKNAEISKVFYTALVWYA